MPSKKFSDANNPLSGGGDTPPKLDVIDADRAIYGGDVVGIPRSGIIKAPPIALTEIKPDVKQPRRIIPASIRKGWTGDVARIPDMLREWRAAAERALGEPIHTERLIDKLGDGRDADKDIPPIVDEYFALCALAASIKRDGLANPIQVTRANVIVTGERRYMAHWLLNTWLGGFDTIPAQVVGEADVWLQAAENGARKPLNPIGMARQLALLIMEMYHGDDGVKFDDIGFFDHERLFYAQVANGVSYPIKKGLGERVLQVTGLNSKAQVNQYRALLKISNELWDEADMNNYAEGRIREMVKPQDRSTIVDLSAQNGGQAQAEFFRMLGGVLSDIRNGKGETGLYLVLGGYHVFVWYHHAKRCYEMLRWSGEDVHVRDLVDAKAALGVMYDVLPTTGRWRVANKSEFDKATRPNYGTGWGQQMVAPNDDRKAKQFEAFSKLMSRSLQQLMTPSAQRSGIYCRINNVFVTWREGKDGFVIFKEGKAYQSMTTDDTLQFVFNICPDYGTWRAMSRTDYDRIFDAPKTLKPLQTTDLKQVMHDMGIGEDDEYIGEDVRHPFGGGSDMDDDPEYQLHLKEMAQIEADFADYVPPDLPYNPPKDPRYVAQNSLLHHFIAMVIGWGGMYNHTVPSELTRLRDMTPLDIKRMVDGGLAVDEIAQDLTEMGNRVLDYLGEVHQQLADAQQAIFNDAGGVE